MELLPGALRCSVVSDLEDSVVALELSLWRLKHLSGVAPSS